MIDKRCVLTYCRHSLFGAGTHGGAAGTGLGRYHDSSSYQRFASQTPEEIGDKTDGIREFSASTIGRGL